MPGQFAQGFEGDENPPSTSNRADAARPGIPADGVRGQGGQARSLFDINGKGLHSVPSSLSAGPGLL